MLSAPSVSRSLAEKSGVDDFAARLYHPRLMKLAIISDIHGNLPALYTALEHIDQWRPDGVFVNGDIVNRGPWPAECLALMEERRQTEGWQLIRGNHEDYVISNTNPRLPSSGPEFEIRRNSYWTYQKLHGDMRVLRQMPNLISFADPGGAEVRLTHASTRSNRESLFSDMADAVLRDKIGPMPALFATAHTHRAFIRQVDQTIILNTGSVGMPFDNDPRLGYGQLCWQGNHWHVEIVRLPYDVQAAIDGFSSTGFLDEAGPVARLMLRELELAMPLTYAWEREYRRAILAGKISVAASIEAVLALTR